MERQVGAGKGRTQARLRDAVRADPAIDFREGGCLLSLSLSLRASMNKNEPMLTSAMLDTDSTDRRADFLETDLAATHAINISNTETERRFPFPPPPPSSYLDLAFLQRRQVAPVVIEYQCTRLPREKG